LIKIFNNFNIKSNLKTINKTKNHKHTNNETQTYRRNNRTFLLLTASLPNKNIPLAKRKNKQRSCFHFLPCLFLTRIRFHNLQPPPLLYILSGKSVLRAIQNPQRKVALAAKQKQFQHFTSKKPKANKHQPTNRYANAAFPKRDCASENASTRGLGFFPFFLRINLANFFFHFLRRLFFLLEPQAPALEKNLFVDSQATSRI
jgi:hypothetical protein